MKKGKVLKLLKKFEVLCDGFHATYTAGQYVYKPENGHLYKVTGEGGKTNTKALIEESE